MNESLKKAQKAYNQKCKMLQIRINKETEADILEWVSRNRFATRIKELIREDIRKNPRRSKEFHQSRKEGYFRKHCHEDHVRQGDRLHGASVGG